MKKILLGLRMMIKRLTLFYAPSTKMFMKRGNKYFIAMEEGLIDSCY